MRKEIGRSGAGAPSGRSAEPEPSSTVSAVPASVPNARKRRHRNPRDNFVKRRKFATSLKKGTGGINPCFRPSNEASKTDLVEFHREEMALRRAHQRKRQSGFSVVPRKDAA